MRSDLSDVQRYAAKLAELGYSDVDSVSDADILDDATLSSDAGLSKAEVCASVIVFFFCELRGTAVHAPPTHTRT